MISWIIVSYETGTEISFPVLRLVISITVVKTNLRKTNLKTYWMRDNKVAIYAITNCFFLMLLSFAIVKYFFETCKRTNLNLFLGFVPCKQTDS